MSDARRRQKSFWALMVTQFFGAFNDNVLKILVTLQIVALVTVSERRDQLVDLTGVVFVAPFLIFSMISGRVADRASKSRVAVGTKIWELGVVAVAVIALFTGSILAMMASLFIISMQATFFSPAKYGILPELYGEEKLSEANGWLNLMTFVAILLGTLIGTFLGNRLGPAAGVMAAASVLGLIASLLIQHLPPAKPTEPLAWNPISDFWANWRIIREDEALKLSVIAVNYFWFMGAIVQLTIFIFAKDSMHPGPWVHAWSEIFTAPPSQFLAGLLIIALAIGVGVGSYLAGRVSHGRVEVGLVPIGALGCGFFSMMAAWAHDLTPLCLLAYLALGFFAGFYEIPLMALIQWRAPAAERGRVLATVNWLSFVAIAAASGVLLLVHTVFHWDPVDTMLALGIFSLLGAAIILYGIPEMGNRMILYLLTNTYFRIQVHGTENIPTRGPALLVSNSLSPEDVLLIASAAPRRVRFMTDDTDYQNHWLRPLLRRMRAISVDDTTDRVWRALDRGELVCLMEGSQGSEKSSRARAALERNLNCPVVPIHLAHAQHAQNVQDPGTSWSILQRIPYRVTVTIGASGSSTAG